MICILLAPHAVVAYIPAFISRYTSSKVEDASQKINFYQSRTELQASYLDSLESLKNEKSVPRENDNRYGSQDSRSQDPVNQLSSYENSQYTNTPNNPVPDPGSASNIRQWWSQKIDTAISQHPFEDNEGPGRGVGSTASYLSRIGPSTDSKTQEYSNLNSYETSDSSMNGATVSFGGSSSYETTSSYPNGIVTTDETASPEGIKQDYSTDLTDAVLPVNTKLLSLADDILQRVEGLVGTSNSIIMTEDDNATTRLSITKFAK